MSEAAKSTIERWGEALEARDPGTWSHCKRVATFATVLARALKLPEEEVRVVSCGALLHEIGKLEVPEAILRKPAVLTADEMLIMRGYCERGYRFVRINKFNVGTNPIETLDRRMREAVSSERTQSRAVANIHSAIEGLQNGDMKECPKCKNLRKIEEFKDSALASGVGRFCAECKTRKVPRRTRATAATHSAPVSQQGSNPCPKCNAKMILRRGRFGPFYGCSKYPYCKGTRQLSGTVGFRK